MSAEELEIQFKRRDFIILQRGSLALAEKQGMERGIEKGREEGRKEIARNLLDILDDAMIAAKTGLSVAQVRQLRLSLS
jgi:predicted transposase/invertase (TIGR01784 family)